MPGENTPGETVLAGMPPPWGRLLCPHLPSLWDWLNGKPQSSTLQPIGPFWDMSVLLQPRPVCKAAETPATVNGARHRCRAALLGARRGPAEPMLAGMPNLPTMNLASFAQRALTADAEILFLKQNVPAATSAHSTCSDTGSISRIYAQQNSMLNSTLSVSREVHRRSTLVKPRKRSDKHEWLVIPTHGINMSGVK